MSNEAIALDHLVQSLSMLNRATKTVQAKSRKQQKLYTVKNLLVSNLIEFYPEHVWVRYDVMPNGLRTVLVSIHSRTPRCVHVPLGQLSGYAQRWVRERLAWDDLDAQPAMVG